MKYSQPIALVVGAMLFAKGQVAAAGPNPVTITFGQTTRDIGDQGPMNESGYRYESFGASWALVSTADWPHGGDGAALFSFYGRFPEVGNVTTFRRLDATPFLFQSLELRGRLEGEPNSVVVAYGFLNGQEVANQTLQSSSETWRVESTNASFRSPVDELRLKVVEVHGAAIMFDNLVFGSVPEPNSCALLALGLPALVWRRTRRIR